MVYKVLEVEDIGKVIPLYIDYYNTQDEAVWKLKPCTDEFIK